MNCKQCRFHWDNYITMDKLEKPQDSMLRGKLTPCYILDIDESPLGCTIPDSHSINGDIH